MFNFIPPTAQSANKRAEFDELRRRINGRPQSFHGHNIQAIPATVVNLPKTNQPLCSSFSDDAIIEHTSSYIVRQSRHWPDSIVNCFNRDDITELKPLVDATSESQGNQSFRGIVEFTIKSRDIMPHDQVVAHRFRVDMYRSNNSGTEHVVDLKVHVQRPVPEHCCSEDNGDDHNITPCKRSINNQHTIESPEEDCFVFSDINVLCTMLAIKKAIFKNNSQIFRSVYTLPPTQRYQIYYYTGHKGLCLFDDDSIVGCHLRDLDELHMRIVPSPPTTKEDRCNRCLIRRFEEAEGGPGVVSNGESYWLSGRRCPNDLLQEPRRSLDAVLDRSIHYDSDTD